MRAAAMLDQIDRLPCPQRELAEAERRLDESNAERDEYQTERDEAIEYQTATSDVLNVISRCAADVQPVLDAVVETAGRLCGADIASIAIREGEVYRYVSASGAEPEYWVILQQRRIVPGRDSMAGRVALEGRVVQIADIRADPDFAVAETVASGRRTVLGVPLLRERAVIFPSFEHISACIT